MHLLDLKRRAGHRISIWALIFAMMLTFITSALIIPASAANFGNAGDAARDMGEAISDAADDLGSGVGEAVSDVGDGMGEAVSDITDGADDGKVNDTDGIIGNESSGADEAPESGDGMTDDGKSNAGWIALAIAIVVIVAVVILIIVLIPKKKDNE